MEIGIFGLPLSGKSTLFTLLTGVEPHSSHKNEAHTAVAKVHDRRVDELSKIFNPKKTVYATVSFTDIPGYDLAANQKEKNRILQFIQNSEAVMAVVRAFKDTSVPWPTGAYTPVKQLETIETELLVRDMEVVEGRLLKLEEAKKKRKLSADEERETELLHLIEKGFDENSFASQLELAEDDLKLLGSLALFTAKPIIVAINLDEDQFSANDYPERETLLQRISERNFAHIELSGKIESELMELSEEDRGIFMEELGISESGIERLSRVVYEHMGLISFLTVGEDEVRAWTIKKNTPAKAAAGKIHTDLERSFIRAEVIPYDEFMTVRNMQEAKAKGMVKIVGKEEIVKDGDIFHVRANA
ncbi:MULTISPECIES: redox-regulated ATPase YchF [Mesotoga]|uniref:redox-regulated ATPase YchF n=2 Tax=Kosmotogaceae TaxID=1643948 RepID=UPI0002C99CDF|nr:MULTISPECIES: redox-regulated ATPase YchF [Mesotoga]MCP5460683.1 redox-regulated ATPase YchF [Thermotogota bacterium]CCU86301.1 GTP-binding protein YchF [Mesotoga infera]HNQ71143.1 redox-regulated ATPase YchF [Mesotoga prima]HNS75983.1 redox-regulated ATPase YchF [Mesotoga prima]HPE53861.1 redox-regulated ATPase YchF [Mesotoga prima]